MGTKGAIYRPTNYKQCFYWSHPGREIITSIKVYFLNSLRNLIFVLLYIILLENVQGWCKVNRKYKFNKPDYQLNMRELQLEICSLGRGSVHS